MKPKHPTVHRKSIRIYAAEFNGVVVSQLTRLPSGLNGEDAQKFLDAGSLWSFELSYKAHVDYHLSERPVYQDKVDENAANLFVSNLDEKLTLYFRFHGRDHLDKTDFMSRLLDKQKDEKWFGEYFGQNSKQPV